MRCHPFLMKHLSWHAWPRTADKRPSMMSRSCCRCRCSSAERAARRSERPAQSEQINQNNPHPGAPHGAPLRKLPPALYARRATAAAAATAATVATHAPALPVAAPFGSGGASADGLGAGGAVDTVAEIPVLTAAVVIAVVVAAWANTRPVLESDTTSLVTFTTASMAGVLTVEAPPTVEKVLLVGLLVTVWRLPDAVLAAVVSAPKLLRLREHASAGKKGANGKRQIRRDTQRTLCTHSTVTPVVALWLPPVLPCLRT